MKSNSLLIPQDEWSKYKEIITNEVNSILSSEFFVNSERTKSLMEYLIRNNLKSPGEQISPYQIAEDIFKRDSDFDPSIDPIVRVQMARTRVALERYNHQSINKDIIINLPKRSYNIEIYKGIKKSDRLTEGNNNKIDLTPVAVWFEPIEVIDDPYGDKGKALTNKIVESIRSISYFNIAGVRPWPFKNMSSIQLVVSLSIEKSSNNKSNLLNIMLLNPENLSVLWQNRIGIGDYENDISELERVVNNILGSFWGDLTKQILLNNKLPWLNKLHEYLYNEETFSELDKIEEVHSMFNNGEGIEDWDVFHKLTYIQLLIHSWSSGLSSPNVSKEKAYEIIKELSEVYPNNIRIKIAKMGVDTYLGKVETQFKITDIKKVPEDLLEQYAVILVKNKQWENYINLIRSMDNFKGGLSYLYIFKVYYYILRNEMSKAKELFEKSHAKTGFLLNNLLYILCSDNEDTIMFKRQLLEIEALQFSFTNKIDKLLDSYFHIDDVKFLSNLYSKKVKI